MEDLNNRPGIRTTRELVTMTFGATMRRRMQTRSLLKQSIAFERRKALNVLIISIAIAIENSDWLDSDCTNQQHQSENKAKHRSKLTVYEVLRSVPRSPRATDAAAVLKQAM